MADLDRVTAAPGGARPAVPQPPVGPTSTPPGRMLWLVGCCVALLGLGGVAAVIAFWPAESGGPAASPSAGTGVVGAGPGVGLLASAPSGGAPGGAVGPGATASTVPLPSLSAGATVTAAPTLGPPVAADSLKVSYVAASGLTSQSVTVTVANPASRDQTWHSVVMRLEGVTLLVSTDDRTITYKAVGSAHCFFAGPGIAEVPGGGSVTFTVKVTGLLGRTADVALDQPVCT